MFEKVLKKLEVKEPRAREEIEELLKKSDYSVCPNIVRIYDFIEITGASGADSSDARKIAVQCIHLGTVHNPQKLCLGNFQECEKYKEILKYQDLMR